MCRALLYLGQPVLLDSLLFQPDSALVKQSYMPNMLHMLNLAGFGLRASFVPDGGTTPITYPKAVRDYDGLEFALNKRLSNRWSGRVSYLWSQLEGN